MPEQISKREGKLAKDGKTGMKVYLKPEEVETLGLKPGDNVNVIANADGSITIRPVAPPNVYEKFLSNMIVGGVELGDPIEIGDAHIIPILAKQILPARDYLTVPEAMSRGWLRFTDTGGISGVHVTNTGSLGVLILQGQVLEGSTQARTVISNLILAPNESIILPARCVHSTRAIQANAPMTLSGMAPRTVAFGLMVPKSKVSQQRVWGDIGCVMATTVPISSFFTNANVKIDQSAWLQTTDLSRAVKSLNQVSNFVAANVESHLTGKKLKWESK